MQARLWTAVAIPALLVSLLVSLQGCDNGRGGGKVDSGLPLSYDSGLPDFASSDLAQSGCAGQGAGCYTVYAHGDHDLYSIDLMTKQLIHVGPFKAPMVVSGSNMIEDVITDLAVAPDDTIWVISIGSLYTASPVDGHVTRVGSLTNCGDVCVALSFTPDGKLYTADFKGAFCSIDLSVSPPTVAKVTTLAQGLAVTGDLVAVADGTMYATAYKLADASNMGSQLNNLLVKIEPSTGLVSSPIGKTGYPKLFGTAFALGKVFGFTHDGTGDVVTIDPTTGVGTLFGSFNDSGGMPIKFAGAGVNAMVSPIP